MNPNTKKALSWILILTGMIFLFLTTASPFLHNHNADFEHHEDCPVSRMEATLFIIILTIILAFVQTLQQRGSVLCHRDLVIISQVASSPLKLRAPPA